MCIASGAEEPLYRMRLLTRGTSLVETATHRHSSSTSIDVQEEEEQEYEKREIEQNDC